MGYNYKKNYNNDYEYSNNFRKDCDNRPHHEYDDLYLGGNTTSAISYEESIKRPHQTSPHSRSEYGREARRHGTRESYRRRSPIADYDNFMRDDSLKKRSKQTRNDIQNVFYQFEIEKDKYREKKRKSRSPRRKEGYEGNIYEEPERIIDYDKYFEKTTHREKNPKKYTNEGKIRENRRSIKQNDQYVFSYKEPKLYEKVFKSKVKDREMSPLSSETEINNIDYPVLAFKDKSRSAKDKSSKLIYLPVVPIEEKSKSQGSRKHRIQSSQAGDTQVFAANLNENKNVFTAEENNKNKHDLKNQAESTLQTEESLLSRDTKLENSIARTSTETQTDESSISYHNRPSSPSYKKTGSILGSILQKAEFKSKLKDDRFTKGARKYESTIKNKSFATQINIDIEPAVTRKRFGSEITKRNPTDETHHIEYKQIEDPLHDDYPVTKDYIKVSDNSSIHMSNNITSNAADTSEISVRTITPINPIRDNKQNKYLEKHSNSSSKKHRESIYPRNQSVIYKESFDTSRETPMISQLQPQDIQVFRSAINNEFKKSVAQRSSVAPQKRQSTDSTRNSLMMKSSHRKSSHMVDQKSIYTNGQSDNSLNRSKSKEHIFNREEEEEVEPEIQKERISVAKQRDSSVVNKKSPSVVRKSGVDRPHRDTSLVDRKSQTVVRESSVNRTNKNPSLATKKSQSAIKESRVERPKSATDTNQYNIENQSGKGKNSEVKKSRTSNLNEPKKSKSILRTALFSRKNSKALNKSVKYENQSVRPIVTDNVEPTDERKSLESGSGEHQLQKSGVRSSKKSEINQSRNSEIKSKTSKNKLSTLFSRSKSRIESGNEVDPARQSTRQSFVNGPGEYTDKERKSEIRKSQIEEKPTKPFFSGIFSRKSNTGIGENEVETQQKSMRQSKSSPEEENEFQESQAKGNKITSLTKTPSQATLQQQKSKSLIGTQSQSKFQEKTPSQVNKTKSKSRVFSFLRKSQAKDEPETSSTEPERANSRQQELEPEPECPSEVSSEPTAEAERKQVRNESRNKEEKPCECITQYVKQARECGNFFLGTTLHKQVMDILKVV